MKENKIIEILTEIKNKCKAKEDDIRENLGLSLAEYRALLCIKIGEKITCHEFSKRMDLSLSRGSRVIEKLFQQGFIDRLDCTADRRSKNVILTESGRVICGKINKSRQNCEDRLAAAYSRDKYNALKDELRSLVQKL